MLRQVAPRVAIPTIYRPCALDFDAQHSSTALCDTAHGRAPLPSVAVERSGDELQERRSEAMIDVLWDGPSGDAGERSISLLEAISRRSGTNVSVFLDLSAAYLVTAQRRHNVDDLLGALDAASRGLTLDSANAAMIYNRALAAEWLGLDDVAIVAWSSFLARDSVTSWASEARARLQAIRARRSTTHAPDSSSGDSSLALYARRMPAEARVLGWEGLLGAWASAVLADSVSAERGALARAAHIARVLEHEGDGSLASAIRYIRTVNASKPRRALATAHELYRTAQQRYRAARYESADSLLALAEPLAVASPPLRHWITVTRAATRSYLKDTQDGERRAAQTVVAADSTREPALLGRACWILGTIELRRGSHDVGVGHLEEAERMFQRSGETENRAAVEGVLGEEALLVGNLDRALTYGWYALTATRAYRGSVWRHNTLLFLIRAAANAHRGWAVAALATEDASTTRVNGTAAYEAEANIGLARASLALGDSNAAAQSIGVATTALRAVPAGVVREQLSADARIVRGRLVLRQNAGAALAAADSSITAYASAANPVKLIPSLLLRADALLASGSPAARGIAEAALRHAARELQLRRDNVSAAAVRLALLDAAHDIVDRLVSLLVVEGRYRAALSAASWGRQPFIDGSPTDVSTASEPLSADALGLQYAAIGDTVFVWTRHGRDIGFHRLAAPRAILSAQIDRVSAGLELGMSADTVRADLADLFDIFIRPVSSELRGVHELDITADRPIDAVPFSALYDRHSRQYVIEEFAIAHRSRFEDSAALAEARPRSSVTVPLFVSAPNPGTIAGHELDSLTEADSEVASAAPLYRRSVVYAGSAVNDTRLVASLSHARMFHFAGHVVFDDVTPDASYLAVPPRGVTATELASLDLRRLGLVILSACDAARAGTAHNAGLIGISDAFIAAGAGGVIAPAWRVTDHGAAALTRAFHRAYATSGNASRSLRRAQLDLIRSSDPDLATPSAWAAFRFVSR